MKEPHVEQIHIEGEEELSTIAELSIADDQYYRIKSEDLNGVEVVHHTAVGDVRSCYFPLSEMTMRNMEREGVIYCSDCGREVESDERVWTSGRICCLECGSKRYRFNDAEEYVCNRCGSDIEPGDVWCFPESDTYEDICLCGRCALIKHLSPMWRTWLKRT